MEILVIGSRSTLKNGIVTLIKHGRGGDMPKKTTVEVPDSTAWQWDEASRILDTTKKATMMLAMDRLYYTLIEKWSTQDTARFSLASLNTLLPKDPKTQDAWDKVKQQIEAEYGVSIDK